jgi:hypothetical protein
MLTAIALVFLAGTGPAVQAEPAPEWNAHFTGNKGWIGGDGVATTALSRDRVLWLFGDTIIGEVKDGGRPGSTMVSNSLGLSGRGKDAPIRFIFGKYKDGKPTSFFTPADEVGWFWPLSAIRLRDKLYMFFIQVEKTQGKGVFAFRSIGNWLITVDNADADPDAWRVHQTKLAFAQFGSAVLANEGQLYVYGYHEQGKGIGRRMLTVARVPIAKVEDLTAWQFLSKTGWSDKATDAADVASGLATEYSVSRLADGRFVLVYTENGLSERIVARFAKEPEGPWSEPVLLYRCPEMARDKGVFTYAAKAHPWASSDALLVSYCTNTWDFWQAFRDEKVYRPKFVRVKVPR